jgi:uracil-DNA glycosylase
MELSELKEKVAECTLCDLYKNRNKAVFSRGFYKAPIVICGMCPGPDENEVGYPFVGPAGKILDLALDEVFTGETESSDYVYITNLVKCFVKPGTTLDKKWMNTCLPYFVVQLILIKPKVIVGLGKDVCNYLLNSDTPIGAMRGKVYDYSKSIKMVCTYHPSYLVRGGGTKHRDFKKLVSDIKMACDLI